MSDGAKVGKTRGIGGMLECLTCGFGNSGKGYQAIGWPGIYLVSIK